MLKGALFIASYVSAMVPVKSPKEYYVQQEVIVLFCETVERWVYRGAKPMWRSCGVEQNVKEMCRVLFQGLEASVSHARHDR